jgi:predicted Zn-dependent peptidase
MILVGDLETDSMIDLVKKYFERIPRGETEPPDVATLEEKQYGEKRLVAEAETSPTAEVWYHTVAWKHPDSYALEVLAEIMSGKTGRLYKNLVEEKGIAKSSARRGRRMFGGGALEVSAGQDSRKYAGAFQVSAAGVSGVRAEQLEQAIYEVVEDLKADPVSAEELQKVKNQMRVRKIRFMDMMSGIGILFFLGQNAALGDWTEANNNQDKCDVVTAEDVQGVAGKYLAKDQRNVLIINAEGGPEGEEQSGEDPRFARAKQMISSIQDASRLEQMIGMFSARLGEVEDPGERSQMEQLLKMAEARLEELKAAEDD